MGISFELMLGSESFGEGELEKGYLGGDRWLVMVRVCYSGPPDINKFNSSLSLLSTYHISISKYPSPLCFLRYDRSSIYNL